MVTSLDPGSHHLKEVSHIPDDIVWMKVFFFLYYSVFQFASKVRSSLSFLFLKEPIHICIFIMY